MKTAYWLNPKIFTLGLEGHTNLLYNFKISINVTDYALLAGFMNIERCLLVMNIEIRYDKMNIKYIHQQG